VQVTIREGNTGGRHRGDVRAGAAPQTPASATPCGQTPAGAGAPWKPGRALATHAGATAAEAERQGNVPRAPPFMTRPRSVLYSDRFPHATGHRQHTQDLPDRRQPRGASRSQSRSTVRVSCATKRAPLGRGVPCLRGVAFVVHARRHGERCFRDGFGSGYPN